MRRRGKGKAIAWGKFAPTTGDLAGLAAIMLCVADRAEENTRH